MIESEDRNVAAHGFIINSNGDDLFLPACALPSWWCSSWLFYRGLVILLALKEARCLVSKLFDASRLTLWQDTTAGYIALAIFQLLWQAQNEHTSSTEHWLEERGRENSKL